MSGAICFAGYFGGLGDLEHALWRTQRLHLVGKTRDAPFPISIVLVSHDRHLVDRVATSIIGLSGDGRVTTYADYTQWEIDRRESLLGRRTGISSAAPSEKKGEILSHTERKELAALERKLSKLDDQIASMKKALEAPEVASNGAELSKRWETIAEREAEYATLLGRWEELEARNS